MTLTTENITILRKSWAAAEPHAMELLTCFYDKLFDMAPEAAAMFAGTDMDAQKKKLGAALGLVVREVENPGALMPALTSLGRRHGEIGVTAGQYDIVGAALLTAMEESLGDAFDPVSREAWATAYQTVAAAMIAGGETAENADAA